MKYAVIKVVNGNFFIHSEGFTNLDSAKKNYFGVCQSLIDESTVETASVMIVNEQLDSIRGYKEFISHIKPEEETTPTE